MWFDILKESRQVVDSKTNLNVISEPLGEKGEDKFPCCEEAREKVLQIIDFREKDFVKEANCEDLYWKIVSLTQPDDIDFKDDVFFQIGLDWEECVNSSTHSEQEGWFNDYREVK